MADYGIQHRVSSVANAHSNCRAELKERLSENVKKLKPLEVGDACVVQNQSGNYPKRWDKTSTVIEIGKFDQYRVRMDGSRRITLRNKKFLRKVDSFKDTFVPATPRACYPQCQIQSNCHCQEAATAQQGQ